MNKVLRKQSIHPSMIDAAVADDTADVVADDVADDGAAEVVQILSDAFLIYSDIFLFAPISFLISATIWIYIIFFIHSLIWIVLL